MGVGDLSLKDLMDTSDLEGATGLLLRVTTSFGYTQYLGVYPLDSDLLIADMLELKAEEPDDWPANTYETVVLYPVLHAQNGPPQPEGQDGPSLRKVAKSVTRWLALAWQELLGAS